MTLRRLAIVAAVVLALGAGSVFAVWYFFIRSDSPPAVSLEAALSSVTPQSTTSAPATSDLTGTWQVVRGANSFVGYRVDETLAGFGANTAVGRTQDLQGTLSYDGRAITAVNVTANLDALASDRSQRDGALRTQAIETSRFPTATFVLTSSISVGTPAEGQTVTQKATGNLTLHGVTRPVEISIEGVLRGGQLIVVGSTDILFADYGISQPRAATVLSVENHGTMEFQLVFSKGGA